MQESGTFSLRGLLIPMTPLSFNYQPDNLRARELFQQHQLFVYQQTDRIFAILMPLQWLAGIAAAYFVSPFTWAGVESRVHIHVWAALLLGGLITLLPMVLVITRPGALITRNIVAISQMLMTGLLIHLSGGRIETHFHVFGSLAFLAFYRDWRVLIPATLVTALDHLLRGWFYPMSMYGILTGGEWRWVEHAGWVIFIDMFLIASCRYSAKEMWNIAYRTAHLDASEERYRAVVEQTQEGIFLLDHENLRIIESNEAFSRLLGCANVEEAKSLTVFDFSTAERSEFERLLHPELASPKTISGETVFRRRDDSLLSVEVHVSPISYAGKVVFCVNAKDITERKIAEDELKKAHNELEQRVSDRTAELVQTNEAMLAEVNERKRAERELSEAQSFLHSVVNGVPNPIFVKTEQGKFHLVNTAFAQFYGIPAQELVGKGDTDFQKAEEAEIFIEDDKEVLETLKEKMIMEEKHTDFRGKVRWFQTVKRPLVFGANQPRFLLGISTDLTERKALESQLRQAQKLESIGQLAAGIAHEINTPTQFVGDNTRFVQDSFGDLETVLSKFGHLLESARTGITPPELIAEVEKEIQLADVEYLLEEIPHALQQSLEGINRIAKIVQSMKDFAHPGSHEKKAADLNKAIESTITVARNEWKYVAEMETRFDETLPPVPCLLGEFNQVVLNMIINASHAIADAVSARIIDKGKITVTTHNLDHQWAEIRISDTGTGIPPQARSRIFDPFFTTKEVGKGTGQGLAISHNVIVEKHKGQLLFETEMGQGTTFIIRLPLDQIEQ